MSCDPIDVPALRISLNLVMAMATLAVECGACTYFYPTVQVGPSFHVRVADRGRSVKGLRLKVGGRQTVTDNHGVAVFRDMRPGLYFMSADHDAGIADGVELQIRPDGPADVTVPLRWPAIAPVPVRSMKGTLRSPGFIDGQSQTALSLDLLVGISGRPLKSAESTADGEFNFGEITPGLYFLRVDSTGLIAVAVDPSAQADHLDLDLGWSSCGMSYTDQNRCSHNEPQVEQLCGRVLDSSGGVIPDAHILLFDLNEKPKLIQRIESDREGNFASPKSLAGTYQLVISSAGFAPLRTTVHVQPTGDLTCRQLLDVELGVSGFCSAVNVQLSR